jgi:hypothetical protein
MCGMSWLIRWVMAFGGDFSVLRAKGVNQFLSLAQAFTPGTAGIDVTLEFKPL